MEVRPWARVVGDVNVRLRRGAWYEVVRLTQDAVVLEVDNRSLSIPRTAVEILTVRPDQWSVVPRPYDAVDIPVSWGSQYGVCPRLISACHDVVTETDYPLCGGAGSPSWGRRRKRERSAEISFRCIGRRRSGLRRRRRSEFGWSFGHCGLAECDVQVRLVSRSCRSFRVTRHAHRRP